MELYRFDPLATSVKQTVSRRAAVGRLGGGGLAAALLATVGLQRRAAAQDATPAAPAGWRTEHLEVEFTPGTPLPAVSITLAGGGPPQRGDWFYIDAPLYAAGDAGGTQIGTYQCFGAWTHAADDAAAPDLRLTTVQFRFDDGAIMGVINELGADPSAIVGAVQGGTGRYTGALGTFQQLPGPGVTAVPATTDAAGTAVPATTDAAGTAGPATTDAAGTPAAAPAVVRAPFDLILPDLG